LAAIVFKHENSTAQVYLREVGGSRVFVVIVGQFEASTLYGAVKHVAVARPVTHAVMVSIIELLSGALRDVSITRVDTQRHFYYAQANIGHENRELAVDMRPSDALTLAVHAEVPIMIAEDFLLLTV
jgi:bifunctional DNase/RNase